MSWLQGGIIENTYKITLNMNNMEIIQFLQNYFAKEGDTFLSDDFLAVFSNQLDGDGTVEMCDWFSHHHHRIIFRINY